MPRAAFALLLLGTVFLLRIFYAGYVWADEGLWFTAAQELLRGKTLYSEIWFDKPPAVAWTYAALFALAGPSLAAVRLFTILYATAIALALWHIGRQLWGEREGRAAALLYAVYNATYIHSQVQPMAVDQLMLLPYLYAGFFFLRGQVFWSGALAAAAFSINPKAAALFIFFAGVDFLRLSGASSPFLRRWLLVAAGFAAGSAPWALYLAAGGKWQAYVRDFWGWGLNYVAVYSPAAAVANGLRRTLNYAGFHFSLFLGLAMLVVSSRRGGEDRERAASHALWLWLAASFLGVAAGGRFFPRYFYQVLPLLCLLAARGYCRLPSLERGRGAAALRVLFFLGIAFSLVRFHSRAAALAYEWAGGRPTAYMASWDDPAMDRDNREIARRLHGTLFVWGYRPEIYFFCGCTPAASFLSSQPLTGVPADVHLRESLSVAPALAAENRRRLLDELGRSRPGFIVDGLGPYNPALAMESFLELRLFLEHDYVRRGQAGHGIIYARK